MQPNYILRATDAYLKPKEMKAIIRWVRSAVWMITGIIILGSLIFQDNLFLELNWSTRLLYIALLAWTLATSMNWEYVPAPLELQFYDDYFVMFLPKRWYSRRVTRQTTYTMKYADVTKCVYFETSQRVQIYGNGTSVWYRYKKDGTLPEEPTEVRNFTEGMIYFCIRLSPEVDIIREIESHSPLRVSIEK